MKRGWLGVLVLVFIAISSCTKRSQDMEVGLPDGKTLKLPELETLRITIGSEPPSLDWHKATDTTSSLIINNFMDGLVAYDVTKSELPLIPALAESWTSEQDSRIWTFKIRKDVRWSDGVAFTAQHVIDGWKRLLSPETASEYAYFLFSIKNAREFNSGKIKDFAQVGVRIVDPQTVRVELTGPMSYFPSLLTHQSTFPVRLDVVEKHGDLWTEPQNIVTLGAYRLKVWKHDDLIVLEKNPEYFLAEVKIPFILARMIEKSSTATRLFESRRLDSVHDLPSKELRKLSQKKEYKFDNTLLTYFYGFNVTRPPFDNVKVRQAFSHAINREELTRLLAGGQEPMTGWLPPGLLGYNPDIGLKFDPEKARSLLKEAGYENPSQLPKVILGFNTNEDHQRVAENIQSQLKKNLGVDVELKNEEWKVYLATLNSDPYPMFRFGWLADYPDPANFMNLMTSYSENNRTKWANARFDALVDQAAEEQDEAKRTELYQQAQKILVEEQVPVIPLYTGVIQVLVSDRVENYPLNHLMYFRYYNTSLN